jgi:hypothetical protein
VPISPDFDLKALVNNTNNFDWVTRVSTETLKEHSIQSFEALVLAVVIQSGKPLVIEDWGESLPPWLFSRKWLEDNVGTKGKHHCATSPNLVLTLNLGSREGSRYSQCSRYTHDDRPLPEIYGAAHEAIHTLQLSRSQTTTIISERY